MGIQGFTKFINDRESAFFENYQLRNTTLIVDGHSISCQLYNWKHWIYDTRSNNSFGGDYDKYAYGVRMFFRHLLSVHVKPIVVFDGGFEHRKLPTILSRMQDKIELGRRLCPEMEKRQPNQVVFPLFLREAFKEVLRHLDIKVLMCEYEGDSEIASIAKTLNCPVLTFDSDYFLFGAKYIPFATVVPLLTTSRDKRNKFISCKLYRRDKLLGMYSGLTENSLFLLPVLLGNDYIKSVVFNKFLKSVTVDMSDWQRRIQQLLVWLKENSPESAIKQILDSFNTKQQKLFILNRIEKIVSNYQFTVGKVFKYLDLIDDVTNDKIDFDKLRQIDDDNWENVKDEEVFKDDHLEQSNTSKNPVSKTFIDNYTRALYPSSFMDILTRNIYYCIPQIECYEKENSHTSSYPILTAIHKILTQNFSDNLTIVGRGNDDSVENYIQNVYPDALPTLEEIENLPLEKRRDILLNILKIDTNFSKVLQNFPSAWHTFLISLNYATRETIISGNLSYAFILSFFILNYIDNRIGYYRSPHKLNEMYNHKIEKIQSSSYPPQFKADKTCFSSLPTKECWKFMQTVIRFFQTSTENFDRRLIHAMAQFQSVLLHVKYLNSILKLPFPNRPVHFIIDGTFIYNVASYLFRANKQDVSEVFGKSCPIVLATLNYAKEHIENEINLH